MLDHCHKHRPLAITLAALLAMSSCAAQVVAQGIGSHLGLGLVGGEAAGLDDGYVHFGGFVPAAQRDDSSLLFVDGSLLLFNDSTDAIGGNLGFGSRAFSDITGTILGGSIYYNRRDLGADEFDQIGVGIESLGTNFDARLNAAIPLDDADGSSLAFSTIDAEIGALVAAPGWSQLYAFVGAYGLFHDVADDAAGVRGRVELRMADQCFVGGYIQHDDLFDTTGGVTLEFRFGRSGSAAEASATNLLARLGDPVRRRRHVVVGESASMGIAATSLGTTSTGGPTTGGPTVTTGTVGGPLTPSEGGRERYRLPLRADDL